MDTDEPERANAGFASAGVRGRVGESPSAEQSDEERFGPGLRGSSLAANKKGKGKRPSYNNSKSAPLLGSDSDDEDNGKVWQKTSRVQVTGYLPDLQPLLRPGNYRVEVGEDGKMIFQKEERDSLQTGAMPSTPVTSIFRPQRSPGGTKLKPRTSIIKEWFREGTVRGSVFNLCSATLGAGTLSLPYAFSKTGVLLGVAMLIVACAATSFSIELLIMCREATGLKSYEEMTVALFGKRVGLVVELNIIIFCFGTAVAYCKALQGILNPVMLLANAPDWLLGSTGEKLTITIFWAAIMFPLSLIKEMNSLRVSSII
jgi:hypothetical protein